MPIDMLSVELEYSIVDFSLDSVGDSDLVSCERDVMGIHGRVMLENLRVIRIALQIICVASVKRCNRAAGERDSTRSYVLNLSTGDTTLVATTDGQEVGSPEWSPTVIICWLPLTWPESARLDDMQLATVVLAEGFNMSKTPS